MERWWVKVSRFSPISQWRNATEPTQLWFRWVRMVEPRDGVLNALSWQTSLRKERTRTWELKDEQQRTHHPLGESPSNPSGFNLWWWMGCDGWFTTNGCSWFHYRFGMGGRGEQLPRGEQRCAVAHQSEREWVGSYPPVEELARIHL